jgi:hypothetical protein
VSDEKVPVAPKPVPVKTRSRKGPKTNNEALRAWGPIAAAAVAIVLPMFVLGWIAVASSGTPETPEPMLAVGLPGGVVIPDQLIPGKDEAVAAPVIDQVAAVDVKLPKVDAADRKAPARKAEPVCETFGTEVEFARNTSEAARMAREERKLTFVLHVSGNFEDAQFT